jgi:hemolysin activation/secretion protein
MAHRNQNTTTELNFSLQSRQSDRFINNVQLVPQNLTTLSFGVKHLRLGETARNSYDMTFTFGTKLFGADIDESGIGSDIPRAQFSKVSAGWQRQAALGQAGTLVTDLRMQWSPDTLYSTEQLSLGSLSTVRGYEASVANGDMGVYLRNDLYLTSDIWGFLPDETAARVAQKTQSHVFFDMGATYDYASEKTKTAAGFGLGISYAHRRFNVSGTVGFPVVEDAEVGVGEPIFQLRVDAKAW